MSSWLTATWSRQPWQDSNWSTVINQASIFSSPLKELAAMYRSRKTSWMRERQARWQARLKERYIAAWYLERMLPRHEALWAAAQVCPCRSELDRRCPRGSNCYGQRLAAGYYYDKDGNTKIRTCYTVPGTTFQTFQSEISAQSGFGFRRNKRNYVVEAEEERKELSCTDRMTHADYLKATKILLANIRDDKENEISAQGRQRNPQDSRFATSLPESRFATSQSNKENPLRPTLLPLPPLLPIGTGDTRVQ